MNRVISPFRNEMIKLIKATDNEIVNRQVEISPADEIYPSMKKLWGDTRSLAQLSADRDHPFVEAYERHLKSLCSEEYYKAYFGIPE